VANKSKTQDRDRRAKVEAMRREQQARERRKSVLFIAIAVVIGVGLVVAAALPPYLKSRNDPTKKSLSSFGVAASAAACGAVINDPPTKSGVHVGPGTNTPTKTRVKYTTVPPSSGEHFVTPVVPAKAFYTAKDRPPMENLVHNLEHGYTIIWYDSTVTGKQLSDLKNISQSARRTAAAGSTGKFIVSAWDTSYGAFPAGKHIALSHWAAKQGHRELCGKVSGAVVNSFMKTFPYTDSPEPNAA
jgi:hypothetical protein